MVEGIRCQLTLPKLMGEERGGGGEEESGEKKEDAAKRSRPHVQS